MEKIFSQGSICCFSGCSPIFVPECFCASVYIFSVSETITACLPSLYTHTLLEGMLHGCTIKLPQPVLSFVQTTTFCKEQLPVSFPHETVGMTCTIH